MRPLVDVEWSESILETILANNLTLLDIRREVSSAGFIRSSLQLNDESSKFDGP
jgi:hypothetical protein